MDRGRPDHRRGWLPQRSPPTLLGHPKAPSEVRIGRSLRAAGAAVRRARRSERDAGPSDPLQSGQLQGLAPPTSPLPSSCRCRRDDARSSHGLCSPPRSFVYRSGPTVPGRRWLPGRSLEAPCLRALSRQAAAGRWATDIPSRVPPRPSSRSPACAAPAGGRSRAACRRLFSVVPRPPRRDPAPSLGRSRARWRSQCPEKSVRCAKLVERVPRCLRPSRRRRSDDLPDGSPARPLYGPSWGW